MFASSLQQTNIRMHRTKMIPSRNEGLPLTPAPAARAGMKGSHAPDSPDLHLSIIFAEALRSAGLTKASRELSSV